MSVNNDNFLIENNDVMLAQDAVNDITDSSIRSRAAANVLSAFLAPKYFTDTNIDINSGIHNVVKVLKDIDVSDIYIKGNYIDVRIYFNDNELFVPKSHFEIGMLPVAYMFLKLDEDLSSGDVTGFVFPEDIDTDTDIDGYYQVKEDSLKSFYDIEQRLATVDDEDIDITFQKNVFDFLDGKTRGQDLYKVLVKSAIARNFLAETANADHIFNALDITNFEISNVSKDNYEFSTNNADDTSDILHQSDEDMFLDSIDTFEPIEPADAVFDDMPDIEEDSLRIVSDELSDNIDDSEDLNLLEESDESLLETAFDSDTSEEILMETPYQENNGITEAAEQEEISEITTDGEDEKLELEEEEEEEQLVENSEFVSDVESSGQLERRISNTGSVRPQIVMIDDEYDTISVDEPEEDDEFEELSKFDYSTEIMPSISSIESGAQPSDTITEEMIVSSEKAHTENTSDSKEDSLENKEQIDNLFGQNPHKTVNTYKKKSSPLPLLGLIVILCALAYYGYTKFYSPLPNVINDTNSGTNYENNVTAEEKEKTKNVAMPVETVENVQIPKAKDEVSSVAIPFIEQNLNVSIDVSNLSVNWEVPLSYANNTTAKRYFVKIGKILQLNLKTELLFLSSSPITNKISVELEFNPSTNKFVISKFINSSGVTSVDNVIKDTIEKVLNMNLSTNMSVFKNLQGSPVLVIKL